MITRRRGKRTVQCDADDEPKQVSSTTTCSPSTTTITQDTISINSSPSSSVCCDSLDSKSSTPTATTRGGARRGNVRSIADDLNDYVASKRCKLICSGVDAVVEKLEENFFSKDVGAAAAAATSAGRSGVVGKGKGKPKIAKIKIKPKPKTDPIPTNSTASIITITTTQIRKAAKNPKQKNNNNNDLLHIPSAIERSKIYNESAIAIARKESTCLPSNGSRPWQCQVIIKDSMGASSDVDTTWTSPAVATTHFQAGKKKAETTGGGAKNKTKKYPPLFRWFRNKIELAVLPHFLQMIDVVDVNCGKLKKIRVVQEEIDEQMDDSKATDLEERKVTTLSTLAWEDINHVIPEIERRWVSPDQTMFRTRAAMLEHVEMLLERDTLVDRILHGCGRRGDMLRPVKATRSKALEAGHYRFLRDGLWVIGQENDWLIERLEERFMNDVEKKTQNMKKIGGKVGRRKDDDKAMEEDVEHSLEEELKNSRNEVLKGKQWGLTEEQTLLCYNAVMDQYEKVMITVKARALYHELEDGFDVFRERGRGRFDMQLPVFDTPEYDFLTDLKRAAWMEVVKTILGDDATLVHKGAFLSMPGSETQVYHQDGVHLTTKYQRPCHAINVFIPLVELTGKNGPTEFCLGTHMLGYEYYTKDMVEIPEVSAGTPVMFDYRLGHRGLRNTTAQCRPVLYLTYTSASNEFRDSVNFSTKRYRKLGDLIEKPMSREERALKRMRESG